MAIASDFGSEDWGFESLRRRNRFRTPLTFKPSAHSVNRRMSIESAEFPQPQQVAWPSGLRRWFKAPVSSGAWVRIPPLPRSFWSKAIWKSIVGLLTTFTFIRPVGLVVWFSLRVREVPGSIPGQALNLLQTILFADSRDYDLTLKVHLNTTIGGPMV